MKKLNRKGFTLIELLAVIVILAIIVVVTVPTILNSINDARMSSLHSLAKEVANWYDTSSAQDKIALTGNKILNGATATEEWQCLGEVKNSDDKNLFELYGLSENDIVKDGTSPVDGSFIEDYYNFDPEEYGRYNLTYEYPGISIDDMCSAIKIVNNRAWVILISTSDGKFNTNGLVRTYAPSFAEAAYNYSV